MIVRKAVLATFTVAFVVTGSAFAVGPAFDVMASAFVLAEGGRKTAPGVTAAAPDADMQAVLDQLGKLGGRSQVSSSFGFQAPRFCWPMTHQPINR